MVADGVHGRRSLPLAVVLLVMVLCTTGAGVATGNADRVITDDRITASSGLATSLLHRGVVWTLNDSGHPAQVFAINPDGSTAATITIAGEAARDWEAITSLRNPVRGGQPYLAIGDIGDNDYQHASGRIVIIPEPKTLVSQTVKPQRVVRFGYPTAPRNAEALLADPRTGLLYVVTKALYGSEIFVIRENAWPATSTGVSGLVTAKRVATSSAGLITDGTFLPDGRMLLRGYGTLYLLDAPEKADGRLPPLDSLELPQQQQGESLTTQDGGRIALIGSVGSDQPVLRLDLRALGMNATTTVRSDALTAASPAAGGISANTVLAGGAGLAALTLLALGIVALVSRR